MDTRRLFLLGAGLGFLFLGLACGGSSYTSGPPAPPPPPPPPAFAATVSDLVKNHTNDTEPPANLDSLNLNGSGIEDPHEFDALLGIQ